ncbi:MAG: ATP-binding cassette domain-containing protein, partial [Akkermansiaceae bacterium]|nr:ATP-binding cassette domain-containing protein [Akkermansiaceae bacterium]
MSSIHEPAAGASPEEAGSPRGRQDDTDVLVVAEEVRKKFCRDLKRSLFYGVQDVAREALGMRQRGDRLRKDEFWAVDGASFELRRGESLGLIGHNGAGKTTLLKMLNGLIRPDTGYI